MGSDSLVDEIYAFLGPEEHFAFHESFPKAITKTEFTLKIPKSFKRILLYETWDRTYSLRHSDFKQSLTFNPADNKEMMTLRKSFYNLDILRRYWKISKKQAKKFLRSLLPKIKAGTAEPRD